MTEMDVLNHRLDAVEEDIKILYKKVNEVTLIQVQSVTKLDSMLVTLGELKASIEALKRRPGWLWDKFVVTAISAACGALVSIIL